MVFEPSAYRAPPQACPPPLNAPPEPPKAELETTRHALSDNVPRLPMAPPNPFPPDAPDPGCPPTTTLLLTMHWDNCTLAPFAIRMPPPYTFSPLNPEAPFVPTTRPSFMARLKNRTLPLATLNNLLLLFPLTLTRPPP